MSPFTPQGNVNDLVEQFLRHLAARQKSAATLRAYGSDLRAFRDWLAQQPGARRMDQVGRPELRRYLVELEQQGLKATSVQRKLASLRALFGWLRQEGGAEKNPAKLLKGPKAPRRVPRFLTTTEVDALLGQTFAETPQGLRDRAILELLYSTGCRVSECAGLRMRALDLEEEIGRAHV